MNTFHYLFISLFDFALGLFILSKDYKNKKNISLFIFSVNLAVWTFLYYLLYITQQALFYSRLMIFTGLFMPWTFYFFIKYFIDGQAKITLKEIVYAPISTLFFVVFLPTKLYISDANFVNGNTVYKAGPFYLLQGIFFVLFGLYSISRLFKMLPFSSKIKRKQILLLIIGTIAGIVWAYIFSFFLPIINMFALHYLAAYSSVLVLTVYAMAIIRYRLLDIEVIVNRISAYLYSILLLLLPGAIIFVLYSKFFMLGYNLPTFIFFSLIIILSGVLFHPLRLRLQTTPDKFLFKKKYIYDQAIKELAEISTRKLKLDEVIKIFSSKAKEVFKTKRAEVFIVDSDGDYQIS